MEIDGHTELYGFIAYPAKHSHSPAMYNCSFRYYDMNACYLAFEVAPDKLSDAVLGIKSLGIRGINLSMPFKKEIIPFLDGITPEAQLVKAVNTVKNENGRLIGETTDGAGLFEDLQAHGWNLKGKKVTILGAGGAGRSIIAAASKYGVSKVNIFKRPNATYTRLQEWVAAVAAKSKTEFNVYPYSDSKRMRAVLKQSDILINATNVGMTEQKLPFEEDMLESLSARQLVYDIIYQPAETVLLKRAKEHGCQVCNGFGMLLWQGALAFEFWTGKKMPVEEVKKILY
ncbi:shikimate/quinate 5-dehydrogenase [Liquorilactobacillus sucicola DSM 21376 = JCM 15457]|uniref:Shikimate dehydrogenase (NADP(+)) n=1 Tax=Liquorilactobacillus sucicola DSM 21376 = JCM 15457 TaxID=1423806 RepID=A0A023CXC2_9LACO|nr:shikimate dehydrogenase [Liquorilactobacillus sucicola]KRN06994.1 shikimate 5-dehydrogenase [Liquorilactobacillus sucicola DSM 21376 = JCM 15457]GAJ26479.1 shikimate/quinate 5-dehydrogenase [Liquorilactobacillus sucicola DSM 21376 = JCM 15457]